MNLDLINRSDITDVQKKIINEIRTLINYKNLEPGDKLPSERMMSEKFGVTRTSIREAIQKLEYYGLLKSIPQSGTFVADIGVIALNGMIDDILQLKEPDFKSLVETRILMELKSVSYAALRRSEKELQQIKKALKAYSDKVMKGEDAVQEDLLFHLAIANASGNSTLNTFMLKITPEIITNFEKYHVCDDDQAFKGIKEHEEIVQAIEIQDPKLAKAKLKKHFKALYQYCYDA